MTLITVPCVSGKFPVASPANVSLHKAHLLLGLFPSYTSAHVDRYLCCVRSICGPSAV